MHHEHGAKFLGFPGVDIHLKNGVADPVLALDPCFQPGVVLDDRGHDACVLVAGADPERTAGLDLGRPPPSGRDEDKGKKIKIMSRKEEERKREVK